MLFLIGVFVDESNADDFASRESNNRSGLFARTEDLNFGDESGDRTFFSGPGAGVFLFGEREVRESW